MFYYMISGKFHSGIPFTLLVKANFINPNTDDILAFAEDKGFAFDDVKHFNHPKQVSAKKFNIITDGQALNMPSYVGWVNNDDGGLYEPKKPENKKSPFVCPICGANIKYERIDDGTTTLIIDKAGEFKDVSVDSKGSTRVYCSVDETHEISDSKQDLIIRLVKKEGY